MVGMERGRILAVVTSAHSLDATQRREAALLAGSLGLVNEWCGNFDRFRASRSGRFFFWAMRQYERWGAIKAWWAAI